MNIRKDESLFDYLPPEMTAEILSRVDPMTRVSEVSQSFYAIFNDSYVHKKFLRKLFKRHFPYLYPDLKNKKDVDWRAEFKAAEDREYKDMSAELTKLFYLVKESMIDAVRKFEISYEDMSAHDQSKYQLRHWAGRSRNQELLDYFYSLSKKHFSNADGSIDVNKRDHWQLTILHQVVCFHQPAYIIRSLIEQGSEVEARCTGGNTPLFSAALYDRVDLVELLIANHAGVNTVNDTGISPLYAASLYGHLAVVSSLLNHGADVNLANAVGISPLYIAAQEGRLDVVNYLIEHGAAVNQVNNDGATPLFVAAQCGHLDVVIALYQHGANIDAAMLDGFTAIVIAAQAGHPDMVKYLLKYGANVNDAGVNGGTALFAAAQNGHSDVVKILLAESSIDINAVFRSTRLSLIDFSNRFDVDVQQRMLAFLDAQQDPNDIHMLPIDMVYVMGHEDIVVMLEKKQAELQRRQIPSPS